MTAGRHVLDGTPPVRSRAIWLARILLAASLGLAPVAGRAETAGTQVSMELTRPAARAMARRALDIGKPDLAATIARQLLATDPQDVPALLLLTAGLSRSGHAAEAVGQGRRAFALAATGPQHFEAAYLTAEALSLADRPGAAKIWLRRADRFSPGPAQQKILREAFRKLDARTPLRLSFTFAAGPSNNVNGGSLHDTFWFGNIPLPIDAALPGFAASGQFRLNWRLPAGENHAINLYATAGHREVWLADRATEIDPTARGSDYNSDALDFGVAANGKTAGELIWSVEARAGRRWYGSGMESNTQKLAFGLAHALPKNRSLSFDLAAEAVQYPARPVADSVKLSAEAQVWQPVGRGAVALSLGYTDVGSNAAGVAWRGPSVGVEWRPPTLPHGIAMSVFGTVQVKDYWKTTMKPDLGIDLGASAKFSEWSMMGFAPTASLTASRNFSDLVVRDTFDMSFAVGLSSTF